MKNVAEYLRDVAARNFIRWARDSYVDAAVKTAVLSAEANRLAGEKRGDEAVEVGRRAQEELRRAIGVRESVAAVLGEEEANKLEQALRMHYEERKKNPGNEIESR